MVDWGKRIARLASRIDRRIDELKSRAEGPLRIVAYTGYGTPHELFVAGRVLAGNADDSAEDAGWWQKLRENYRRLETDEVPAARVRVKLYGTTTDAIADSEGHFRAWVQPHDLPPRLWHDVDIELLDPPAPMPVLQTGRVMTPLPGAGFGIISDLDDTVLRTDVANPIRLLRSVLFENARSRLPFDGVAAFYRALHGGRSGADGNPIFYVSSSPWNLYELLTEFLELNGIPGGPLLLRDWGITDEAVLPTNHRTHKLAHIRHILATYPLPFILIGDSGQRDPEIYREVVAEHPSRVLAVYIRNVTPDPLRQGRIRALADEIRRAGSSLLLADDTLAAAKHAAAHDWISAVALARVAADPDVVDTNDPGPSNEVLVEDDRHEEAERN